jgi:DoxX-like family
MRTSENSGGGRNVAVAAVEGSVQAGYPAGLVLPIGVVLFACLAVYVIPRTAVLGAILLTGYLGGATATLVQMSNPLFAFPVGVGVLVWAVLA